MTPPGDDGVTPGELARQIAIFQAEANRIHEAFDRRLTEMAIRFIDGGVYGADKARFADQMTEIRSDIADARAASKTQYDTMRSDLKESREKQATHRSVLMTGLLFPVLVSVLMLVLTIFLTGSHR